MADDYLIGKDIGELKARLEALERRVSACECHKRKEGEPVRYLGLAPETKEKATPGITLRPDLDPDKYENCSSNGLIRQKYYNGICYCQICCNGQWWYVNKPDGVGQRCGDPAINVECGGVMRLLSC